MRKFCAAFMCSNYEKSFQFPRGIPLPCTSLQQIRLLFDSDVIALVVRAELPALPELDGRLYVVSRVGILTALEEDTPTERLYSAPV